MFAKKHRLGKTSDVKKVFAKGRAFFNPLLTVKFFAQPGGATRFTVVVSTKVSKSAVKRNRLKRLVREFIRVRQKSFKAGDYAIILKPSSAHHPEPLLLQRLAETLQNFKLVLK